MFARTARRLHLLARPFHGRSLTVALPGLAAGACLAVCAALAVAAPAGATSVGAAAPGRALTPSPSAVVSSLADSGAGSLRAALLAANAAPSATTVTFSVAGVITLAKALPAVSSRVTIDATSAPGHEAGGPPVVEVDCDGHLGLRFAPGSGGSQLLGVAVDGAGGNGVTLAAGSVTLDGDYVGLNLSGGALGNQGAGVFAAPGSSHNLIGLNPAGNSGAVANVISGNSGAGIVLAGSSANTVVANRIGTNAAGTSAVPNGGDGILVTGDSDGNEIGGTVFTDAATGRTNNPTGSKGTVTPVFVVPPLGNQISGNAGNGVAILHGARGNSLNGNFIGTTADGDAALGNVHDGVWISGSNDNSLTGCKVVNNPFVYYNVISGNNENGLRITNSDRTTVQGNFFGAGANNTDLVPNRLNGIVVDGSSAHTKVGGVIPLGNVAAGNGLNGIKVSGRARGFTTFNTFGGLLAFKGAAPNGNDGLLITSSGGNNLARTNVFSGNARNGIELAGKASGVTVDPNLVGVTTNGMSPLPNGGDGLLIRGDAHRNTIGGSRVSVIPQNTFSANGRYGIAIGGRAHDNRVFSSFVGTKIFGVDGLGNLAGGIRISGTAHGNTIGRARMLPANLISGNAGTGVSLGSGTHGNRVINNYIGLNRFGRWLSNSGRAIVNTGHGNRFHGNRRRP
jgi:parallel beta-helix repeat protein